VPITAALRLTDEYMPCHRQIYGAGQSKPDDPYIHQFLTQTDEYNITLVGPETDECNLNIFVGTDEFKKPDE
jgi:hypothetical protein